MNLEQILDFLRNDRAINENISHWKSFPAKPAQYADFPGTLDRRLVNGLQERGIKQLYTHQAEAVEAIRDGRDVRRGHPHRVGQNALLQPAGD